MEKRQMPKVSLVVAVYNLEKYIAECLDSIINQTFNDIEIICVNDGSKDNSLDILEDYSLKDSRIKIITQPNQGSGAARNTGLAEAKGEYVQFLDGDDYFELEMVGKLYNLAKKHDADISACSSRKVDDNGNITETRNPNSPVNLLKTPFNRPFSYKDFPNDFFDLLGAVPWNKIYRRDMLIENNLRFPKLTGPDDLTFVFMAQACAKNIAVIDDELINYRFSRPGSVFTYRANYASDIIRASVIVQDFLVKTGKYEYLKTAYLNAFKSAIRWETSLCNEEQYENFLRELKTIRPNDWKIFNSALRKNYITPEYLKDFIGDKKVFLWGASNFIKEVLEKEKEHNSNILGIIDGNSAMWGIEHKGYKIYSKDVLNEIDSDGVLLTVINKNESIYPELKKMLSENYPQINLLPNIFD